ncbi:MAG: hypothetical protein DRQ08_01055 [Candidatus Latescibacterota bacterium]|nr:MAG: hypothetical protein DRQ08_01055 [Candidatus Latescibacterota bacterium]
MAKLIKGRQVLEDAPLEVSVGRTFHGPPPQPEVRTHRCGDRVEQIEVVCSCGERIFIKLEYEGER